MITTRPSSFYTLHSRTCRWLWMLDRRRMRCSVLPCVAVAASHSLATQHRSLACLLESCLVMRPSSFIGYTSPAVHLTSSFSSQTAALRMTLRISHWHPSMQQDHNVLAPQPTTRSTCSCFHYHANRLIHQPSTPPPHHPTILLSPPASSPLLSLPSRHTLTFAFPAHPFSTAASPPTCPLLCYFHIF